MPATTFAVGDRVENRPYDDDRFVVEGVVTAVYSDGSPEVAAMVGGEYCRFPADPAKTTKTS